MLKRLIPLGVALLCVLHASVSLANPLQISIATGDQAGEVQVYLTNSGAEPVASILNTLRKTIQLLPFVELTMTPTPPSMIR